MGEERKHIDLFTAEEAAAYLHLDSVATLDTLRRKEWLQGYTAGKGLLYWREDLDDCALHIVGKVPPTRHKTPQLRLGT